MYSDSDSETETVLNEEKNMFYSRQEINYKLIENAIKMLSYRYMLTDDGDKQKLIDESMITKEYIKNIYENGKNKNIFIIYLQHILPIVIAIMDRKIDNIAKGTQIYKILNMFPSDSYYRIIIASDNTNNKIGISQNMYDVISKYKNTEIFLEHELIINKMESHYIPKIEQLSNNEIEKFLNEYEHKKRNMPKILASDPIIRYLNLKAGDIVKIVTPSIQTGYTFSYKVVMPYQFIVN